MSKDTINPSHYQKGPYQLIDLIESLPFCRANIIKYTFRAGLKDPATELEDLQKARWYLDREISRLTRTKS